MIKNIFRTLSIASAFALAILLVPNAGFSQSEPTLSTQVVDAKAQAEELIQTKGIGDVTQERMEARFKEAEALLNEANNLPSSTPEELETKNDTYREALTTYNALIRDLSTLKDYRRIPPVRSGGILPGPGRDYSGGDYVKKKFIPKFINATITLLFSVSILILIVSGVMYILASGDQDAIKKAKDMSMWAIAGTVLAIFSFTIVKFVIGINFGG